MDNSASDMGSTGADAPQISMHQNTISAGRDAIFYIKSTGSELSPSNDRQKIAKWLSSLNYPQIHKDIHDKVTPGTDTWIFKQSAFNEWVARKRINLWGTGIPGSGKTCLISIVIQHLRRENKGPAAYIFCQHQLALSATEALATVLKQIVEFSEEALGHVKRTLFHSCQQNNTKPSRLELVQTLREVMQFVPDIFLLVDALDELADDARSQLLTDLTSLGPPLFVTSRGSLTSLPGFDMPDLEVRASDHDLHRFISSKLKNVSKLHPFFKASGVRVNVINKIQEKCNGMFLLAALQIHALETESITSLAELWKVLNHLPTSLVDQYKLTVDRILNQKPREREIARQAISWVTHAAHSLSIDELLEALTVDIPSATVLHSGYRTTVETIVSACHGLLMVDEESKTMRIVHHTAQEFFERYCQQNTMFAHAHELIANALALYFSQSMLGVQYKTINTVSDIQDITKTNPLFSYACVNLGYHTFQASGKGTGQLPFHVEKLLSTQSCIFLLPIPLSEHVDHAKSIHFKAMYGLTSSLDTKSQTLHDLTTLDCSPLFYACLGGHSKIVAHILRVSGTGLLNNTTAFGATPLHAASVNGHLQVVKQLLAEYKQMPTSSTIPSVPPPRTFNQPGRFHPPPTYQAQVGQVGSGANNSNTLPQAATSVGFMTKAQRIDQWRKGMSDAISVKCNSSEVPSKSRNKRSSAGSINFFLELATPLPSTYSGSSGDIEEQPGFLSCTPDSPQALPSSIQELLQLEHTDSLPHQVAVQQQTAPPFTQDFATLDLNCQSPDRGTALYLAAENGHTLIAKALLECKDVAPNASKASDGWTPLHISAAKGYEATVNLLVAAANLDLCASTKRGWTALHLAAQNGHKPVVHLLVGLSNIDVNTKEEEGWTPLHAAVHNNHTEIVQQLLICQSIDINSRDRAGWTPLHLAAQSGFILIAKLLLARDGINPTAKCNKGRTPLHIAAWKGHSTIVQLLVHLCQDVYSLKDNNGWSPLHHAARYGHPAIVCILLKACNFGSGLSNTIEETPLHLAARSGQEDVTKLFLDSSQGLLWLNIMDERGWTPLHVASEKGAMTIVRLLLTSTTIDPNFQDFKGLSALHLAANCGNESVAQVLLEKVEGENSIKVNIVEKDGCTPLHLAAQHGHENLTRCLLRSPGITVNHQNNQGQTPLHLATQAGHHAIVQLLLNISGSDSGIDVGDNQRRTPLHLATRRGHKALVQLLLDSPQVDVNAKEASGWTPLHFAAQYGYKTILRSLLKSPSINLNTQGKLNWTPLHLAVDMGQTTIVKTLLRSPNIHLNAVTIGGWTPLHLATMRGRSEIFKLILLSGRVDVNQKQEDAWTPLHFAARGGNESITRLLLDTPGIDINVENCQGRTPLHFAAGHGNAVIVNLLVAAPNVNIGVRDKDGCTPLHLARKKQYDPIVSLLSAHSLPSKDTEARGVARSARNSDTGSKSLPSPLEGIFINGLPGMRHQAD